jgi:hypothetical protein
LSEFDNLVQPVERVPHELAVRQEECGCIRLRCTWGHSPEEILAELGSEWTLDRLLCEIHRRPERHP